MNKRDFKKAKVNVEVTPGEALRILRQLQGVSQNELSKLTGIPQSNISAIENGSSQLGRDRTIVLAKALNVHPAVILFPDYSLDQVA